MFDFFDNFFEKTFSVFNRPVKDMSPYKAYKTEKGYILAINTLGVAKEDLQVQLTRPKGLPSNYSELHIKGESHIESINFNNDVDLRIRLKLERKVEEISYKCQDGLTLVFLKLETPHEVAEENIKAKFIDDGADFDW
jgi:HSP20 family molecular chaperone IbpA